MTPAQLALLSGAQEGVEEPDVGTAEDLAEIGRLTRKAA